MAADPHLTMAGGAPGTAAYMSPEQIQTKPLDHQTDPNGFILEEPMGTPALGHRNDEWTSAVGRESGTAGSPVWSPDGSGSPLMREHATPPAISGSKVLEMGCEVVGERSPDREWVYYTQLDSSTSDLYVVENLP